MSQRELQPVDWVEQVVPEWVAASPWGPQPDGRENLVSMGRKHVRPSMQPLSNHTEPLPAATQEEARERLHALMEAWPHQRPRMAVQGGTGLGKTSYAVRRCVELVAFDPRADQKWLMVAPSLERVRSITRLLRHELVARGLQPALAQELLGRQELVLDRGEGWGSRRFGCFDAERAAEYGRRGRNVSREVCGACALRSECSSHGYLAHSKSAMNAAIIVTTAQRLRSLTAKLWATVSGVICDEDVIPLLVETFDVKRKDLRRARRWMREAQRRRRSAGQRIRSFEKPYLGGRALVDGALQALRGAEPDSCVPLMQALPEVCDVYFTDDGARKLRRLLPTTARRRKAGLRRRGHPRQDPRAVAPWEAAESGSAPRQVWGRLVRAVAVDAEAGDPSRSSVVWVARGAGKTAKASIHVHSFDEEVLGRLREVPVMLLDATLHPAAHLLLNLEREEIRFRDKRTVIQVLAPLCRAQDVSTGTSRCLTPLGRRLASRLARTVRGHKAYVLGPKRMVDVIRGTSTTYRGLERVEYVTPKRERGWDADDDVRLFVVVGRYARNTDSCIREAHALRSVMLRRDGTTAQLDAMERPAGPRPFVGRGQPLLYRGNPLERPGPESEDRLAAWIQDWDRTAIVEQFIGRDRSLGAVVVLLRGDPTIAADSLIDFDEMDEAIELVPTPTQPDANEAS